jgi:hypothetical protein
MQIIAEVKPHEPVVIEEVNTMAKLSQQQRQGCRHDLINRNSEERRA